MSITIIDRCGANKPLPKKVLSRAWYAVLMRLMKRCVVDVPPLSVAIVYVDPIEMRTLNKRYRGINRITDVLSFAYADAMGQLSEAEIVICPEQAFVQRKRFGTTILEEFVRLFFHGVLHIYGYDHMSPLDRRVMRRLEDCLMKHTPQAHIT